MVNTLNNRNMYRCNFAHIGDNRCISNPCDESARSKIFTTAETDLGNDVFYAPTLGDCPDAGGNSFLKQAQIDCGISHCHNLCMSTWENNPCHTYYYPSSNVSTVSTARSHV